MNNNKIKLNRRYVNEIQYVNLVEKHWLLSWSTYACHVQ